MLPIHNKFCSHWRFLIIKTTCRVNVICKAVMHFFINFFLVNTTIANKLSCCQYSLKMVKKHLVLFAIKMHLLVIFKQIYHTPTKQNVFYTCFSPQVKQIKWGYTVERMSLWSISFWINKSISCCHWGKERAGVENREKFLAVKF